VRAASEVKAQVYVLRKGVLDAGEGEILPGGLSSRPYDDVDGSERDDEDDDDSL
jgi:hypothetical protein